MARIVSIFLAAATVVFAIFVLFEPGQQNAWNTKVFDQIPDDGSLIVYRRNLDTDTGAISRISLDGKVIWTGFPLNA